MDINESRWDKALRIKTSGRDDSKADQYRYPYEPTPYAVLERLVNSEYISKNNTLIDYGCGKGRVDFFLSYQTKCRSIGIEYDERIYQTALNNQKTGAGAGRCTFLLQNAEKYEVPLEADRFYFFNPFSVEILKSVIGKIIDAYYDDPKEELLFFYYPSDEYVSYLMTVPELAFMDEIDMSDLFEGENKREKILIFEVL